MVSGPSSPWPRAADTVADGPRLGMGAAPQQIGRYVVLGELGRGGMGRVLRAYDPKLRREVALKLVVAAHHDSEAVARIVREAQAMARLSHPNLVPVYDVEHGTDLFIAMERVEGETLGAWLSQPRRWSEVVAAFIAAGRGLAAAHAAGIVHRDFKPANAMVGTDGRVRVMDFGLARGAAAVGDEPSDRSDRDVGLSELTREGTAIGTPAFMAPEQHAGAAIGIASDQYAFCVALFEALYRRRAFDGKDLDALIQAKLRGPPELPSKGRGAVPAWLGPVVLRGLMPDPSKRWPSMDALLSQLERGRARARNRKIAIAIAVAAAVVVVWRLDVRRRTAACVALGAEIERAWSLATRDGLRAAFLATGASSAADAADRALPWLDAHAAQWREARTEVCLDAEVRDTASPASTERAVWCLDERRMRLEALTGELLRADARSVPTAVTAAVALPRIAPCRDASVLERLPAPPPEERRAEIRSLRQNLARIDALEQTRQWDLALTEIQSAREAAETQQWPPLLAEALTREGTLLEHAGRYDEAVAALKRAHSEAARVGAWDLAADAAVRLTFFVGVLQSRHEAGIDWATHAEIALAHAGDPEQLREAARLSNLAAVHHDAGDDVRAREVERESLALTERAVGPDHPDLAATLNNLGNTSYTLGELSDARAMHERALAIREQALGPDHPDVAKSLSNLARVLSASGDAEAARDLLERSVAIWERAVGPDHPDLATALNNLASMDSTLGDQDRALALTERALAIRQKALGPEHPDTASAANNLGLIHLARGEHAKARASLERALAIRQATLDPGHRAVAESLASVGRAALAENDAVAALPLLERAYRSFEDLPGVLPVEITCTFDLARALVATDGDRDRARALAEKVRAAWRSRGRGDSRDVREVDEWLAALDAPSRSDSSQTDRTQPE